MDFHITNQDAYQTVFSHKRTLLSNSANFNGSFRTKNKFMKPSGRRTYLKDEHIVKELIVVVRENS